jgi:hypothetical protein
MSTQQVDNPFQADVRRHGSADVWAQSFYRLLRETGAVYRRADPRDQTLTYIRPALGPTRVTRIPEFLSMATDLIEAVRGDPTSYSGAQASVLTLHEASILFRSCHRAELQAIEFVMREPAVATLGGKVRCLNRWGHFYEEAAAYYWKPASCPEITPLYTTTHLIECFSAVPFQSPHFRNNLIAWLLGAICLDNLKMPMLTIAGNQQKIGKSVTAEACSIILTGAPARAIPPTGAEFTKNLGARFADEERFIFLDNIDLQGRALNNPTLTTLVTSSSRIKSVRKLGHSMELSQSGVLFAVTANHCKLCKDLASRALPIRLFETTPKRLEPSPQDYAMKYRAQLYGELLGLALTEPQNTRYVSSCRFGEWGDFAATRITEKFGPLDVESSVFMEDTMQDLISWCADNVGAEFTAKMLLDDYISKSSEIWPSFHTEFNGNTNKASQKSLVAYILARAAEYPALPTPTDEKIRLTVVERPTRQGIMYHVEQV